MENQVLEQIKGAASAEAIVDIFKANGKEIALEEAQKIIAARDNPKGELSEAELDSIGGGLRDKYDHLVMDTFTSMYRICDAYTKTDYGVFWRCCNSCSNYRIEQFYCKLPEAPNWRTI
ncbi:MAG: hypothetical protein LBL98_06280 [Ruminococcus sp.]|jgi:hypothetical protein|nr:hypothetical protein [Ruminococcus sp.]